MRKAIVFLCAWISMLTIGLSSGCAMVPPTASEIVSSEKESSKKKNSRNSTDEEEETLMIASPKGEIYPYVDEVKEYLQAGAGADVGDYASGVSVAQSSVKLTCECDSERVTQYVVEYATKADYSDAIIQTVSKKKKTLLLYNLYKATKYYVRVTAYEDEEAILEEESTFTTTALGPRFMSIDGIYNVRDLGGYETSFDRRTMQGMLYRGGALLPADVYDCNLTDEGKAYMSEVLGIKTEIDFRTPAEAGNCGGSLIPNAELKYVTLGGYADAFRQSGYKEVFSMLAGVNNYPIYMHCTGGADRTGTVSFLLNALLGVSETELIQDYELTSFSVYGQRNTQRGEYSKYFQEFLERLNAYMGDTLQEKTENYMLTIGVTAEEISSIKAIMFGEISVKK